MRRWIAIAAFACLSVGALTMTASCGSEPGTHASGGDAAAGDGSQGDSTTGDNSLDAAEQNRDGSGGDDSTLGSDSAGDDGGEDSQATDSGSVGDGACVPATGCPATYHCGRYVDPCTGNVFSCGTPCTGGQVCASGGPNSFVCQPKTCTNSCGIVSIDGCGVPISCGGCTGAKVCINNVCVPQPAQDAGPGACQPLTCSPTPDTHLCGIVADVCGNSTSCTCPSGQQCISGVCSLPPPECGSADAGFKCGSVPNACGSGNVACSTCPSGTHCTGGMCESCPAPTCGSATCGTASNACGTSTSCGSPCAYNQVCTGGTCCTHETCADAIEAGAVTGCGPVDLGCGVHQACAVCDGGEVCSTNACIPCVQKTCADYGDAGCGHAIGCGNSGTLNCCASGTTCMGSICCPPGQSNANGICCPPGEVNYGGSCCKPTCDIHQAGPQVSCGVTLFCGG